MADRRGDAFSLIVGLAALAGAGLFLLEQVTSVSVDGGVTAATLWTVLALAGLISAVLGLKHRLRSSSANDDADA